MIITHYYDTYHRFDPEAWTWKCENESFSEYRGRATGDILPDFYDVERDANRFKMNKVQFIDIFGLTWNGKKGNLVNVGSPDVQGHLYYDRERANEDSDATPEISEKYTIYNPPKGYIGIYDSGVKIWVNFKDIKDAVYMYYVNNHLFKDSRLHLCYDGQDYDVYCIETFIRSLIHNLGIDNPIVVKILTEMDKHFTALKNSEDPSIKKFWPGMSSFEYFKENV